MTDDPRIEAVTRVVAPAVHHWHDGLIADCVLCQGVAAEALAAADAMDAMTDDPRIEAVMDSLAVTAPDGDSPPYCEDALAAADAVDPARDLERLAARRALRAIVPVVNIDAVPDRVIRAVKTIVVDALSPEPDA